MNRPTHMLYRAEFGELPPEGPEVCWLCAAPCPEADRSEPISRAASKVVRPTFTDHDRARASYSDTFCHACAWYFEHKIMRPGGKRAMGFYTKTIIVWPDHWREWEREEMVDDLLLWHREGVPADCVLTINFSKQKHVAPWARINRASTRRPWITTDTGAARLPDEFPVLVAAIADLWGRGYGKTMLGAGELNPYTLARSTDPAGDMAVCQLLAPFANSQEMAVATYIVTEDNRERLAREFATLLPRTEPLPAESGRATDHPERSGRSGFQESVPAQVVGNARGARQARRDDIERPDPVEQLALF